MTDVKSKNPDGILSECSLPISPAAAAAEQVPLPNPFDPASLRLSSADTAGIGVKRVLVSIPVNKPNKQEFVRAHRSADYRIDTATLVDSTDRQHYLVSRELWADLSAEIKKVRLVTAVTRHGNLFLWPATLPSPDGNPCRWHESMLSAQSLAVDKWVRVTSESGEYGVYEAQGVLPEPEWPTMPFSEILRLAFQGRYIATMDHPVLRSLRGEI